MADDLEHITTKENPKTGSPEEPNCRSESLSKGLHFAFLIQILSDREPGGSCFKGTVEHIMSGTKLDFNDAGELCAFVREVLEDFVNPE